MPISMVLVFVLTILCFSEVAFSKPRPPSVYIPSKPPVGWKNPNPVCHHGTIIAAGRWEHYKEWLKGRGPTKVTAMEYIIRHTQKVAQNINTNNTRAGMDDSEVRGDRVVLLGPDLTNVEKNHEAAHSLAATGRGNEVIELQNWNTGAHSKNPDKSNVGTTKGIVFQWRSRMPHEPFKKWHVQVREWNDGLPIRKKMTKAEIEDLRDFLQTELNVKPIGRVNPDVSPPPTPPQPEPFPAPDAYSGDEPTPSKPTADKVPGELSDPRLTEYMRRYPDLGPYEIEGLKDYLRYHPKASVDEIDPAVVKRYTYEYSLNTQLPDSGGQSTLNSGAGVAQDLSGTLPMGAGHPGAREKPGTPLSGSASAGGQSVADSQTSAGTMLPGQGEQGAPESGEKSDGTQAGKIESHVDKIESHVDKIESHVDKIESHVDKIKSW